MIEVRKDSICIIGTGITMIGDGGILYLTRSLKLAILFSILMLFLSFIRIKPLQKYAGPLYVVHGIIFSFATIFLTQLVLNESLFDIQLKKILLNMMIFWIIACLLMVLIGSYKIAVIADSLFLMILSTVNYYVYYFRGSEFSPSDIFSAETAGNVAASYHFTYDNPLVYAWVFEILIIWGTICLLPKLSGHSIKKRIIAFGGMIALGIIFLLGTQNIVTGHFLQNGSVDNGFILNFTVQLVKETFPERPDQYNEESIRRINQEYPGSEWKSSEDDPTIIVIMNESLVDLSVLGEVNTNEEATPFLDQLQENVVSGTAWCSVYGGGTPNSEYEFLTGGTMAFLPSGSKPYQQFVGEETYSLVSALGEKGYTTVAMHPYFANGWQRDRVYPALGFDHAYFLEDFDQKNTIRNYISDQEMYDKIIQVYEQRDNDHMFIYGVTMQNHGDYYYEGDDFSNKIQALGYSRTYKDVDQYLTLIHESDQAFQNLLEYFRGVDEEVVIMMYGDHFPNLDEAFLQEFGTPSETLDDRQLKYAVPFWMWANYDIEESTDEKTSINYLSNYLLDVANVDYPAYNLFLKDMQEIIPAINEFGYYSIRQGKTIDFDEAEGQELDALETYSVVQYNSLFEKNEDKLDMVKR